MNNNRLQDNIYEPNLVRSFCYWISRNFPLIAAIMAGLFFPITVLIAFVGVVFNKIKPDGY